MPNVTLTELTDDVYRALGDSGHTASVRNPTIPVGDTVAARDATVHKAINDAIKDHVVKAESLGYFPINDTGTIAVVSGTREYDLDANLQDASSNPNFRSDLVIFRTDTTNPVAMLWPQRGDYRAREFLKNLFSDPRVDIPPITHPVRNSLYLRDSFVGFVSTPTTTMTLTCYYSPMIERLSTGGIENLKDLSLPFLQASGDMLSYYAAITIATGAKMKTEHINRIAELYASRLLHFEDVVRRRKPDVGSRNRSGWLS